MRVLQRVISPSATVWGDGRAFRRPDSSWAVIALQANLNDVSDELALDGVFGRQTEGVVKRFQAHRGLVADGIAGPATQERLCMGLMQPAATAHNLISGLLRGLVENESGFLVAAYTPHPSDSGFDLGAFQDAYTEPGSQDAYLHSLRVAAMAEQTGGELRSRYDLYTGRGIPPRRAWELSALCHNWPWAADRLSRGLPLSDEPAQWVIDASGGRLSTPHEWADAYITKATKYCF